MIGDILYHDLKGKLTVSKKKYRRLGNKSVEFAIDEKGKEHELDGTEIPYEEYEAKEAKKSTPRMSSEVGFIKGEPGADADEDYIIEAVIPRVLEQIRQPEDGEDGEDADIELIVREMLPLVMEQMPRPKELNEALVIERILSRVRIPQDGKQGEKGKDGSPDTPVQVKEKLESLRGDERLDASAIKNLPKPSVVGGGGSYTGLAKVDASGTPGTLQEKLVAGSNVTITKINDTLSIASSGGVGGGQVDTIVAGSNIDVDSTDPANPIVSVETLTLSDISDITASTAEVNVLDGIPATLTATELGYIDGVTSSVQSQINAKQDTLVSATNIKTVNGSTILGAGDLAVSATIEPYYIYVAANDATVREKAVADYQCDGTADQVQINLAIDDVRATGGKVVLSSGNFAIAASVDLTGDVAEDDGNPSVALIGSGAEGTVLVGGSNIDVITTGQRAKFEIAYMTIKAAGSGDCLAQTAGTERGNWQSFVHDIYLQGNFSDHSGWGINMESPFRMRFANIEMNGVANGVNLKCHTESFNPGNISLDRVFVDLWNDASNASAVGFRLAVTNSSSTGVMNLVSVNRLDIAGGSNLTSSIGIEIVGASASYGDSRHHTFNSLNIEDVKTAIKFTRGRDCTFTDLNYIRVLGSGKIIELDSASHNNSFENLYAVGTTGTTFDLITDANSSSALPNRLTRVDGYQPASVTINATLATNTILEHIDLSGGSPTIDSDITTRNNRRTFADVLVDDDAYDATNWNGNLEVPTKNAIRDKIETLGGGGNVSKVGTPVDNQVGVWTGDGTIEGDADLTFDTAANKLSTGALLLSGLTASEMVITDASKNLVSAAVATYPSLTELSYVKGLTSAAQTQITARLPLTGGTMTGNITLGENASVALDPAGSADGKYTGITVAGTAGATLAFGDLVYLAAADSRWELADADAASTSGDVMLGMCVLASAGDGSATTVLLHGIIRADTAFPTLTVSAQVYVSTTAGDIQVAQPSGTDDVIRVVGRALTADEIYFHPSEDYITHT